MAEQTLLLQRVGLSRSIFTFSVTGAFIFLYLRCFIAPGIPLVALGDQILFFGRALHVAQGQVMYRDVFELVTPGTNLLYAAIFRLFGVHAWVIQACSVAVGILIFVLLTRIAGRILQGPLVLLPGMLFLVFDFNSALDMTHHWYSTLAALGAVSVLMGGVSLRRIVGASSLCALATLFTQTQGVLVFAGLLIYLLWVGRSDGEGVSAGAQLAAFVLPFVVIVAGVLGYYVYKAGFHTVFFDLVVFPLRFLSSGEVNSPRTYLHQFPPLHSLGDVIRFVPFVFIYAIVPYAYLFGLYRLWRKGKDMPAVLRQRLVLLHLSGLGLFFSVANAPRFFRLCTVAPPAIVVCVWLLSAPGFARKFTLNLLCVAAVMFAVVLPIRQQIRWRGVLDLPIGRTAFTDRLQFDEFQWVAQRTHPYEPFFNHTALSLYLSLDTPAAAEFINDEGFTRPEQVSAIVEWLKLRRVRFIVMYPKEATYSESRSNSAPFRRYVEENYRLARVFPVAENSRYEELWELRPDVDAQTVR